MNAIDIGFDPKKFAGKFYPVRQTARRLTADEQQTIVAAIAHGGAAKDHAVSALAVANGKRVNRAWIIIDPVAELVDRSRKAM